MTEPRRLLVVCTANLCRSPVAAALLTRKLEGMVDVDGRAWVVTSAGTTEYRGAPEPDTVVAAAALGLDITRHASRRLDASDLASADLIVTMTREHLRDVVALDPSAWPKTFTLRELVRRTIAAPSANGSFDVWRKAVTEGRRTAHLIGSSGDDDVIDPYHRGRAANETMARDLDELTENLLRWGPWNRRADHERSVTHAE